MTLAASFLTPLNTHWVT